MRIDDLGRVSRRAVLGAALGAAGSATLAAAVPSARAATRARATARPTIADLALMHADVVDAATQRIDRDRTVMIRGGRIVAVGRSAEVPVDDVPQLIDLSGRYLIPGLWDMHVHSSSLEIDFPMQIANGVTGVREMWGHPWLHEWRQQVECDAAVGPRQVIASNIIDGSPSLWASYPVPQQPLTPTSPAAARAGVRAEVARGADFVKVYSRVEPVQLRAIADESARLGVRFGGHCPDQVPIEDAAAADMWSFEHLDGVWWSTSRRRAAIERAVDEIIIDPNDTYDSWFAQIGRIEWDAATSYDQRRADRLFDRMRHAESWHVPTLVLQRRVDMPNGSGDARLRYVPAADQQFWAQFAAVMNADRTPAERRQHVLLFGLRQQLVGAMADAGLPLLAGTDVGTTYLYPGFSLHDELDLLVRSGLTPALALQAATCNPARALDRLSDFGSITAGKLADLVAVDGNPLHDINNTRRIHTVVARGNVYDKAARRQLLDAAAQAAQAVQTDAAPRHVGARCGSH